MKMTKDGPGENPLLNGRKLGFQVRGKRIGFARWRKSFLSKGRRYSGFTGKERHRCMWMGSK